jgi:hypothetical protein
MTSHDDFEDNLKSWLEADAAPGAPVGLVEAVVEATRRRRQDPSWLAALRGDRRGRRVRGLGVAHTGPTALATPLPLSITRRRLPSIAPLVALLALALLGATIAVGSLAGRPTGPGLLPSESPSARPTSEASSSPPAPTPLPLGPAVTCVPELVILPSGGSMADECPTAIIAFEGVAARLGTIARVRIEPGDFDCAGHLWPGVGSPPMCFGVLVLPGSAMHGWATFEGTDKVAAIALRRSPASPYSVGAFGPWLGSLAAFSVPPAGWVMP